jgi:hypothetical protein
MTKKTIDPKTFVDALLALVGRAPGESVNAAELAELLGIGLMRFPETETWTLKGWWLRPSSTSRAGCEIAFIDTPTNEEIARAVTIYALRMFRGLDLTHDGRRDKAYMRTVERVAGELAARWSVEAEVAA